MAVLRDYQKTAVTFLLAHLHSILGDAAGCGKTAVALTAARTAGARLVLIVAPRAVIHHWEAEAATWFPELCVLDGRGNGTRRTKVRIQAGGTSGPTALLLNYESFRIDAAKLATLGFDTVIADEGHRLKNRKAQVTRAMRSLVSRRPPTRLWLLTGTPILNRPDEFWSLLALLRPKDYRSYWEWVGRYCNIDMLRYRGASQPVRVIRGLRPGVLPALRAELAGVLIQRSMEELLPHLPPATTTVIEVDLDAEERKAYTDLRRKHWTQLEDGQVVQTVNEISRYTRWRQICSSMEAMGATRERPGSKIAAALELVSDLDPEPVVILTWSKAAARRLAAETGGEVVDGDVGGDDRRLALERFKKGKARIIVGTLSTLGEGVDGLQVARHVILLDRPWTPANEEQAIARIRRSGQVSAVFVWVVTARDTIDGYINKVLAEKRSVIDAIRTGEIG